MKHPMLKNFIIAAAVLVTTTACAPKKPLQNLQNLMEENKEMLAQLMQKSKQPPVQIPASGGQCLTDNRFDQLLTAISHKAEGMEGLDLETLVQPSIQKSPPKQAQAPASNNDEALKEMFLALVKKTEEGDFDTIDPTITSAEFDLLQGLQPPKDQQASINPKATYEDDYSITETSSGSFMIEKNAMPYMSGIISCAYKRVDLIAPVRGKAYIHRIDKSTAIDFSTGKKTALGFDLNAAVCSNKGKILPTRKILTNLRKAEILEFKR